MLVRQAEEDGHGMTWPVEDIEPTNDIGFLRVVVDELVEAGFDVGVFGGWAKELLGLIERRSHRDLDLMVVGPDIDTLDAFVRDRHEVVAKRLSHKRAFILNGILVELFIADRGPNGWTTTFWDRTEHRWPPGGWVECCGLPVASEDVLDSYERVYETLHADCQRFGAV